MRFTFVQNLMENKFESKKMMKARLFLTTLQGSG